MLVGQVARDERGRESFQELDYAAVFGSMAKWAFEIDDPTRIPEVLARAYTEADERAAGAGRAGAAGGRAGRGGRGRRRAALPRRAPGAVGRGARGARARCSRRRSGRSCSSAAGRGTRAGAEAFTRWAEGCGLPVGATFRRQDVVDNLCPSYAGDVGHRRQPEARAADPRLRPAGGGRHAAGRDRDAGLHAARAAGRAAAARPRPPRPRRARPRLPAVAGACSAAWRSSRPPRRWSTGRAGRSWTAAARADYEAWVEHPEAPGDGVDLGEVIAHLRDALDDDAVLTNGAGNFSGWVARFYQWRRFGTQLGPQSGAMGYGVPAALTAKLAAPRARRHRVRRRRRLPDVRDGARHRGPGGAADHRDRGQQRHLRHDPHAPGAALPRARDRHRPRQPRLRRAARGRTARTASGSSTPRRSREALAARARPAAARR